MADWTEKQVPGVGRIREASPLAFPRTAGMKALFVPGERRPPMRARTSDGTLGGLLTVIGEEEREYRTDTHEPPLNLICAIEAVDETRGIPWGGTGFLVTARTLVTAAHNLAQDHPAHGPLRATRIRVRPGRRVGEDPFGAHEAGPADWRLHPLWLDQQVPAHDFATIRLPDPGPAVPGWFGLAALSDAALADRMVNIAGYPLKVGAPGEENRIPADEQFQRLYWHADRVLALSGDQLFYDADTSAGQSGAPVVLMPLADDPFSGPTVVGIHIRGQDGDADPARRLNNSATRLTAPLLDLIAAAVAQE
jgi:V8-like Glu-specific endopeptidase